MRSVITLLIFFFQAEDGIRDKLVTGVQTCALPIYSKGSGFNTGAFKRVRFQYAGGIQKGQVSIRALTRHSKEIGRASCRERVEISVVAVSLKRIVVTA